MRTMVRTGSSHIGTIRARTPRRAAEVVSDRAQAVARDQAAGALDVGGEIGVAEAEPGLAAELRERRHEGPGLAGPSPAGLRIGDARERVRDGIQIRRDAKAEMLEVVAGVAHHHQANRAAAADTDRARAWRRRCRRTAPSRALPRSPEEVQLRLAQQRRRRQRRAIPREAAHEHRGPAFVGLPHQQLRRRGDLVGEADLR